MAPDSTALPAAADVTAHAQPIVRLADGATVGYEALARVGGADAAPPDVWLGRADEAGCRVELELRFLEAICQLGPPPAGSTLFVNAGPAALADGRARAMRGRLPARLVMEVTEQEAIGDYDAFKSTLEPWRFDGVRIAVDDTGSGYASMAHVVQLRPDWLKVDRSLVAGIDGDRNRQALLRALVTFAHEVGAEVIGEGVERREELEALRAAGVDAAQGFLLARPGPGWPRAVDPGHTLAGGRASGQTSALGARVLTRLLAATDATAACEAFTEAVYAHGAFLPSVYLWQNGRLRNRSARGYWQVFDGLPTNAGVIGRAFRTGERCLISDVASDPDYMGINDAIVAEIAVPLVARGQRIGVANVEARTPFAAAEIEALTRCASALAGRLDQVGWTRETGRTDRLIRHAIELSERVDDDRLGTSILRAALDLTGMDSAILVGRPGSAARVADVIGPLGPRFAAVGAEALDELARWAKAVGAVYSTGLAGGVTFPGAQALRDVGAAAILVLPLRSRGREGGILVLGNDSPLPIGPDEIEAAELLAAHAAVTLSSAALVGELRDQAARDPLTGLGHYGTFRAALADAAAGPVGLVLFDLDGFRTANALLGHAAADDLLRDVAVALADELRGERSLFRLAGDEFAALVPGADRRTVERVIRRLRDRLAEVPTTPPGAVTATFGAAVLGAVRAVSPTGAGRDPADALLATATAALDDARATGPSASIVARAVPALATATAAASGR